MGLSLAQVEELTPDQLISAITARYAYDQALQRQAWERTRVGAYFSLAPHVKKGSIKHPQDLFPLPSDPEKVDPNEVTGFAKKHLTEAQKALINRWNGK